MQNYRTQTIPLNQALYETTQAFPVRAYPRTQLGGTEEFRVVDVRLKDGRNWTGLLVHDYDLYLPEWEAPFEPEEVVEIRPTPEAQIPDFTVTDPETLWEGEGERRGIEMGNMIRLHTFGPPRVQEKSDSRSLSAEEAHEEALEEEYRVLSFGGEIPANYGLHNVRLFPGGFACSYFTASTEEARQEVLRPRGVLLWRTLLQEPVQIEGAVTLGDLIRLLDLPPETDTEVASRVGIPSGASLQPWVRALENGSTAYENIRRIEVCPMGHEWEEEYTLEYSAQGIGEEHPGPYSLHGMKPGELSHAELRYNPELVLPVSHDAWMAWKRGIYREWERGDQKEPPPEQPVAFRGKVRATFAQFIGAVLRDLSWGV